MTIIRAGWEVDLKNPNDADPEELAKKVDALIAEGYYRTRGEPVWNKPGKVWVQTMEKRIRRV